MEDGEARKIQVRCGDSRGLVRWLKSGTPCLVPAESLFFSTLIEESRRVVWSPFKLYLVRSSVT